MKFKTELKNNVRPIVDEGIFGKMNHLLTRNIIYAQRGLEEILNRDFFVIAGVLNPSIVHLGTKVLFDEIKFFQKCGKKVVISAADIEAQSVKGISEGDFKEDFEKIFIPYLESSGVDIGNIDFMYQSNQLGRYFKRGISLGRLIDQRKFERIFGTNKFSHYQSFLMSLFDLVYAQETNSSSALIVGGINQDPNVSFIRDILRKAKGINLPAGIYHRFMRGMNGGKMTRKKINSYIVLSDDEVTIQKKINRSRSGGGSTLEEHRRNGGNLEEDAMIEILGYTLEDEVVFQDICSKYESGVLTSGELKKIGTQHVIEVLRRYRGVGKANV